jgi:hypothetical protein
MMKPAAIAALLLTALPLAGCGGEVGTGPQLSVLALLPGRHSSTGSTCRRQLTATTVARSDSSLQITAPSLTGQAEMVVATMTAQGSGGSAQSCTGFGRCDWIPNGFDTVFGTLGPFRSR